MSIRTNDYGLHATRRNSSRSHISVSPQKSGDGSGYSNYNQEFQDNESNYETYEDMPDLNTLKLGSQENILTGHEHNRKILDNRETGAYDASGIMRGHEINDGVYIPSDMESGVIEMPSMDRRSTGGLMSSSESFKYPKDLSDSRSEFGSQFFGNDSNSTVPESPYPSHMQDDYNNFDFESNENLSEPRTKSGYVSSNSDLVLPSLKFDDIKPYKTQESIASKSTGISPEIASISTSSSLYASGRSSSVIQPPSQSSHGVYSGQTAVTGSSETFNVRNSIQRTRYSHKKSNSISSIWSTSSNRQVNLAALKKSLGLRPGEGQRSDYVLAVRKHLGTSYNETPPGKWKLPTGIMPIDRSATSNTSGKYMRMTGGVMTGRSKKGSGVELKHGHLKPRLLAAEVSETGDLPIGANSFLTTINSRSSSHVAKSSESSTLVSFQAADDSNSLDNSLGRSQTTHSHNTSTDTASTKPSSRRASSTSSDSSGSIRDANIGAGFFQHPAYVYGNDDDDENTTEVENSTMKDTSQFYKNGVDYEERPRLVLANPDDQSDSD